MTSGEFHQGDDLKALRHMARALSHGRSVDPRTGVGAAVTRLLNVRCAECGVLAGTLEEYETGTLMWLADGQRARVHRHGYDLVCPTHGVLTTPERDLVQRATAAKRRGHTGNWTVPPRVPPVAP